MGNSKRQLTWEAPLFEELLRQWRTYNQLNLGGMLRPPVFRLSEGRATLGQWSPTYRTLSLSRELVLRERWGVVLEVLKHEMAHQYVSEVLKVDEEPHGPAFKNTCSKLGISTTASGEVRGGSVEEPVRVRRIRKLLALSESSNIHEAELAMKKAQALMLEFHVTLEAESDYCFAEIGPAKGRFFAWEKYISVVLDEFFFVSVIWSLAWKVEEGRSVRVLEIMGRSDDVKMAEYVHDFLRRTGEFMWKKYRKEQGLTRNAERKNYLAGLMLGFRLKMAEGRTECAERGLVWVRDPQLDEYVSRRHPRVKRGRGSRLSGGQAFEQGLQDGERVILNRPIESGSSGRQRALTLRS